MKFFDLFKLLLNNPRLFFDKIKLRIGIPNSDVNKIISHNKTVWADYKNPNAESIILFDYYPLAETELVRSYSLNILAKRFDAKVTLYGLLILHN